MIGGPEDLSKLGGIRAFVTRERRETSGIEIARVIAEISYRASNKLAATTQGYHQKALESSYGASVRPLLLTLDRLEANRVKLSDNTNGKLRNEFEPWIRTMFHRVRNAYFRHILLLTSGESKKGQLSEELFNVGVAEYVHTKLTSQAFVLERSQELARVLFPQDPSKGLSLTVREWTSTTFLQKQGSYVLRSSAIVRTLITNERLVRAITRIDPGIALDDESNPSVSKMLKARVHVVPPMNDPVYVTEPGSKLRGGWKFPSPSMDSPGAAMTALGLAVLRVYSANLQSVDLVGDYYHTIVPGSVAKQSVTPTNNFYVQWSNSNHDESVWLRILNGKAESDGRLRVCLWRWIRMELRFSEKGEAGEGLALALGLNSKAEPILIKRTVTRTQSPVDGKAMPDITSEVSELPALTKTLWVFETTPAPSGLDDLLLPITAVEKPLVDKFQRETFPKPKKGKSKLAQSSANLTKLGPAAKHLIESVETLSPTLASRMSIWLRGFSDERLQAAASKLALAQFDELFIADEVDNDEDSSAEEESDDGADL